MDPAEVSKELRKVADSHKGDFTPTFGIRISDMARDAANAIDALLNSENKGCEHCVGAVPLVRGKTDDRGITLKYPDTLVAYGYDVHGFGGNGLMTKIKYCPMCGGKLNRG